MTRTETVSDRIETARTELTATQLAAGIAFAAAIAFTLVVLQEPLVHDSTHNFRHAAGVICH